MSLPPVLMRRSNLRGAMAVLRDWAMIAALIWIGVTANHPLVYLVLIWVIGAVMFGISDGLMHSAAHYHLFRTKSLNNRLEFLWAWPFLLDTETYRAAHLAHHRDLFGPDDFVPTAYEHAGLLAPKKNFFYLWFLRPILGHVLFNHWFRYTISPRPKMLLLWTPLLALVVALGGFKIFVMYWVVPMLWCAPCYQWWSETGDHLYTRPTGSRTRRGPLWNFLTHYEGWHDLHHRFPGIPWFRLREANRILHWERGEEVTGFIGMYRHLSRRAKELREPNARLPYVDNRNHGALS
jgi:fatty acid desaturase